MPIVRGTQFWCALLSLVFALGMALLFKPQAHSATAPISSWLKSESPVFNTIKATIPSDALPVYTYKDCSPRTKFVTIPKNIIKSQSEVSYETCAAQTAFGQVSVSDGNVRLSDTGIAGSVKTNAGSSKLITPIPRSNHVMTASGGLYGAHRYIIKDFDKNIDTVVQPNGSVIHKLKSGVVETGIKDSAGSLIDFADPRFSDNGKWMVADVNQRGMTRVNVETGETLVFGQPYNYAVGARPQYVSAISGDGRYVLASAYSYGVFKLYDLSTCVLNTNQNLQANCQAKDLLQVVRNRFSNLESIYHAQFSTNYSLRLYIRYGGTQGYFTLTAAGESESKLEYLAVGDSFASGEGTFNYKPGTNIRTPSNKCHLSLSSYPFLLAATTNLNTVQSVACSGAVIKDIVNFNYTEDIAQSKGKNSPSEDSFILNEYLVGYRPQINFIENNKPNNLTVSIGGNDIGFGKIILACVAPGTCYSDSQERLNLLHTIDEQNPRLVSLYEDLKFGASTNARIYVVGYPLLVISGGDCALNVHFNQQEIIFVNEIVVRLNLIIKQAAQKAGVNYIDIEQALAGHRLCETASSNVAVNGLTAGDDKTFSLPIGSNYTVDGYFTGQESYHPNQLGHKLLSQAIANATNKFSSLPPEPPAVSSQANNITVAMASTPQATLALRKILFDDKLTPSIIVSGQTQPLLTKGLQPNTAANVRITSPGGEKSSVIGTYQTSANGQLEISYMLPNTLLTGLYILHVEVKNIAGEHIDIQKAVYVAHSATNIDGDSVINEEEKCLVIEPADIDVDGDGIDDACDPFIGDPPLAVIGQSQQTLSPNSLVRSPDFLMPLINFNPLVNISTSIGLPALTTSQALAVATHASRSPPQVLGITEAANYSIPLSTLSSTRTPDRRNWPVKLFPVLLILMVIILICAVLGLRNKWQKRS